MASTFVNEGRTYLLDFYITLSASNLRVVLFTAPSSVSVSTNLSGLTLATFSGYSAQTPTFGSASIDGNGNAEADASTVTFTHNGGGTANTVAGYGVIDNGTSKLLFAETFAAPIVLNANGQTISVTPKWYRGLLPAPL